MALIILADLFSFRFFNTKLILNIFKLGKEKAWIYLSYNQKFYTLKYNLYLMS